MWNSGRGCQGTPRDFSVIEQVLCVAIVLARCWSPGNCHTKPGQSLPVSPHDLPAGHVATPPSLWGWHSLLSVQLSFIITLVHSCCSSASSCCCCCCCSRQLIEKSAANKVFGKFARPHSSPPCTSSLSLYLSSSPAMMRFFCRFCTLPFAASVFHNLACRCAQFSHILVASCSSPPHAPVRAVGNPFAQGAHNFELSWFSSCLFFLYFELLSFCHSFSFSLLPLLSCFLF